MIEKGDVPEGKTGVIEGNDGHCNRAAKRVPDYRRAGLWAAGRKASGFFTDLGFHAEIERTRFQNQQNGPRSCRCSWRQKCSLARIIDLMEQSGIRSMLLSHPRIRMAMRAAGLAMLALSLSFVAQAGAAVNSVTKKPAATKITAKAKPAKTAKASKAKKRKHAATPVAKKAKAKKRIANNKARQNTTQQPKKPAPVTPVTGMPRTVAKTPDDSDQSRLRASPDIKTLPFANQSCRNGGHVCVVGDGLTGPPETSALPHAKGICRKGDRMFLMAECDTTADLATLAANQDRDENR